MSIYNGKNITISIFGESHGDAVGVLVNGFPAGESIDFNELNSFLSRRAPGKSDLSTERKEDDIPRFISGMDGNHIGGTPLCAVIMNQNQNSHDYDGYKDLPRPSHADFPASTRYLGYADMRGGGHFSGRLTAPLCIAGGIALQILKRRGVEVQGHVLSIGKVRDRSFLETGGMQLLGGELPVFDSAIAEQMRAEILAAKLGCDSIGGIIECRMIGLLDGLGDAIFQSVESRIASIVFGIPAVKGIEFGNGFASARLRGSENNDAFRIKDGKVVTETNNHGGILGGLTTGMPIVFSTAIKPTPSISLPQKTVNLATYKEEGIAIGGRHDPCIVPRAVPCIEAAAAIVALDLII